jgi:endogenous inhibitor of DNA gyrase (YacG/DUF329 family)
MEVRVDFPLDADSFLRRECPNCGTQFKWHHGPTETRPGDAIDPARYTCPLCGEQANHDEWLTQDQLLYQEQVVEFYMQDAVNDALEEEFRGSKDITFTPGRSDAPAPTALHEPNDMLIVEPPCHPWEPVKVPQKRADCGPLHCLVCGDEFSA